MKININKGVTVCGPNINLTDYRVVYSVDETLANYLITVGSAIEVPESKEVEVVETSVEDGSEQSTEGNQQPTIGELLEVVKPTRKKFNPRDHK